MRIKEILDRNIEGNLETDFYTPIRIEFPLNDSKEDELFYYRFINEKSSFIEISINSLTYKIVDITVTSLNDMSRLDENINFKEDLISQKGNLLVDINIFKGNPIVTNNNNFKIYKGNKIIYCILAKEDRKIIVKLSENVSVLLNSKRKVIGLIFTGFLENQWRELNESISASLNI